MNKAEEGKLRNVAYLFICLLLSSVIFVLDLNMPLGVAAGVPYFLVILISLLLSKRYFTLAFGILTSSLVILGYFFLQAAALNG